ncbi:hypothetical protein [Dactylosporangium salmoneum]
MRLTRIAGLTARAACTIGTIVASSWLTLKLAREVSPGTSS